MKPNHSKTSKFGRTTRHTSRHGRSAGTATTPVYISPEVVYEDLLPDLKCGSNGFAWACCPLHDDNKPSLCVNLESGWYKCMSSNCGETGSNIVGFVSRLLGLEYSEARLYVETHYG